MRWLIFAIFVFGMLSALAWHSAVPRYVEDPAKTIFGLLAIVALALVVVLGSTML